jgi:predicted nucleic acid-binding protein
VEKLLSYDGQWAAPRLWRSEFRNILALYGRKDILSFEAVYKIQSQAEALMSGNEYEIDSLSVLLAAHRSGCSAYDCEFVALAQGLDTKLITADKKLKRAFPELAMTAKEYIS